MDEFLPESYTLPNSNDRYLKLPVGATRLRVLSSPVTGYKGWHEDEEGKRKPVRIRQDEAFNLEDIDDPEEVKTFWAMPVWDYNSKSVKIWEPTQSTILKKILSLTKNKEFGSPVGYDLYIEKSGEGLKTKYEITANPPKPLSDEIVTAWAEVQSKGFDLGELYDGADPWSPKKVT